MRVLLAIPVFNEQRYIAGVLGRARQFVDDILVVDDASTDGTPALIAAAGVRSIHHARNAGYGQSLIDAFAYAHREHFDWVITMDCDEQHEPERIPDFLAAIATDQWDVISGSRYLRHDLPADAPPPDRQSINASITRLLNDMLGLHITDAFCGFKAHRVKPAVALGLTEPGYAFPMQLWPRIKRARLKLTEIPVRLIYNDPNRHFGGLLDDPLNRMHHYLSVLAQTLMEP